MGEYLRPIPGVPDRCDCPDCGGLWPDFCSCPDRDDEVEQRDRFANGESTYDG